MIKKIKITPELRQFLLSKKIYFAVNRQDGLADNCILTIDDSTILENNCLYTVSSFDKTLPTIGTHSYSATMFPTQSQIGRYCSIASDISFMSAQHPLDRFTTSSVMISGTSVSDSFGFSDACQIGGFKQVPYDQQMNDGIILGNDVWLGQEVLFKKNIKVGDGAVVGARSIVTKDVPPYAIVAGSPAKIIRYRYPFKIIEQLLILKWWNYPVWKFSSITADEQIESFIDKLQHKIITGEISEYHPEIVTAEDMSNYTD